MNEIVTNSEPADWVSWVLLRDSKEQHKKIVMFMITETRDRKQATKSLGFDRFRSAASRRIDSLLHNVYSEGIRHGLAFRLSIFHIHPIMT